ncbi:MAG: nickel-dependent hydrogenase large subunit [Candidatus Hermodarchaeota archaeon]|nr:nickel-dependent hydrogenase large subunit [Candidatus Hermodarchaeota archaeon]
MTKKKETKKKTIPMQIDDVVAPEYVVPLGPFHPALLEGEYFKLKVEGEKVLDVDLKLGYNYRGIMKLAEDRSYWQNLYLFERVCGICSAAHTTAYTRTVEMLGEIELPDRARYIRTLMAELERIHSHLLWAGVGMELIGFKTLFMLIWRDREHVLDVLESISGNRQHYAMNTIGGVRRDIDKDMIPKIEEKLKVLYKATVTATKAVLEDGGIHARTVGIGTLDKEIAKKICVVGPVARSVGMKIDVRKDDPYDAYDEVPFDVITAEDGDIFSMALVRLGELVESVKISQYCLDKLKTTSGPIRAEVTEFPPGEAVGRVEAPRGELLYYLVSNGTNTPERARVRTPSYLNDYALLFMLRGQDLADVPITVASVDPCMACTDRLTTITDQTTRTQSTNTLREVSKRFRMK